MEAASVLTAQAAFMGVRQHLQRSLVDRNRIIDGMLTALVARRHVVLLGPPGTAKSFLANAFGQCITDARVFTRLMMKTTTTEEVFGAVKFSAMKEDRDERNIDRRLPSCHVAFLDEIFKCNSANLNGMLTILEERKFDNDGVRLDVPLLMAVGASNELPEDESLNALWNRFAVRFWVSDIENEDDFLKMLATGEFVPPPAAARLTLATIEQAQTEARSVVVPEDVQKKLWSIRCGCRDANIFTSSRTFKNALALVKASAWLRGAQTAANLDMEVLSDSLWNAPSEISTVSRIVMAAANPDAEEAQRVLDTIVEAIAEFPFEDLATPARKGGALDKASTLNVQVKQAVSRLTELSKGSTRISEMLGVAQTHHGNMIRALSIANGLI